MPQIILECSQNVIEHSFSTVLLQIHTILTEMLPTQMASCKSRVIRYDDYLISDGAGKNAFVHLSIGVLPGRSVDLLNAVASIILDKMKTALYQSLTELDLQITVAIQDLPPVYHKYVLEK